MSSPQNEAVVPKTSETKEQELSAVQKSRNSYIDSGLYIGMREPPFRVNMDWDTDKTENILVDKTSLENKASIEMELIVVGEISSANFFLTTDGGYTGKDFGNGPVQQFRDVKASCVLTAPRMEPWRTDFQYALASLRWLEQQKITTGTTSRGLFKDNQKMMPKFTHKRFMDRAKLTDSEREMVDSITKPSLTIQDWPVPENLMKNLDEIKESHVVFPIPAYDLNDKLIEPEQYRQKLAGSVVECYFSFSHWFFESKKLHIFNANLRKLKVLDEPRAPPTSPRKHKIFVDMARESSSSSKKTTSQLI